MSGFDFKIYAFNVLTNRIRLGLFHLLSNSVFNMPNAIRFNYFFCLRLQELYASTYANDTIELTEQGNHRWLALYYACICISFLWVGLLYNCNSIYGNIYINTAGGGKRLSEMCHRQEKRGDE